MFWGNPVLPSKLKLLWTILGGSHQCSVWNCKTQTRFSTLPDLALGCEKCLGVLMRRGSYPVRIIKRMLCPMKVLAGRPPTYTTYIIKIGSIWSRSRFSNKVQQQGLARRCCAWLQLSRPCPTHHQNPFPDAVPSLFRSLLAVWQSTATPWVTRSTIHIFAVLMVLETLLHRYLYR